MMLTFHAADLESSDVRALITHHLGEMRSASPADACHVLPIEVLRNPDVTFWSARLEGELMAIGALKQLSDEEGEIKSMRTSPQALGRGVGRALLRHILAEARRRCYRCLRLETGSGPGFEAAVGLYESEGFTRCGPFGGYPDSQFTRFYRLEL